MLPEKIRDLFFFHFFTWSLSYLISVVGVMIQHSVTGVTKMGLIPALSEAEPRPEVVRASLFEILGPEHIGRINGIVQPLGREDEAVVVLGIFVSDAQHSISNDCFESTDGRFESPKKTRETNCNINDLGDYITRRFQCN